MPKILLWLRRVTPLRISMAIAIFFSLIHFVIENEVFRYGILSKRGYLRQLDLKALDLKFQTRDIAKLPDPMVVVAAIDERGIDRYGLWPWRRSVIADFVTAATKGGAKVIAFDAVFSDEDRNASFMDIKNFLDAYNENQLSPDSAGAKTLASQIAAVERANIEALAALDKSLKKDAGNPDLRKAKKVNERVRALLKTAKASLAGYYHRAGEFEMKMSHVVEAGSPDAAFEKALAESPITIMGYINFYSKEDIAGVDEEAMSSAAAYVAKSAIDSVYELRIHESGAELLEPVDVPIDDLWVARAVAMRAPLPRLGRVASSFGYFNAIPDPDGPTRHIRMLNSYEGKLYPALSLLAAARYLETEISPLHGSIRPNTLDGIKLGDLEVPTNLRGHLLVNYYKDPTQYFPSFSVADIIDGTTKPSAYEGKVVLFGMTALGLDQDQRATPFAPNTPGVFIHASAIQNMIDGRFLERYFGIALLEILILILLGLVMGITVPRVPPWAGIFLTLAFVSGFYFFDTQFIFSSGTWMLNVIPIMQAFLIFIGIQLYGYLTEGKEKRKIRKAFQFYLTKSVVDEMLKEPGKLKLGGEKRVCTVLFSDIRGFTTISERLTPEQLSNLLNEYLTPMTNLVFKYDGTLDKYMGDAIMAIFGAPVTYPDHAARACLCALEMMEELHVMQEGWRERGVPELDIGIGMNTGDMAVGNMGSEVRFDYTVMGDNVNLGSRLEGINKQYGTNIIVSGNTRTAAGDRIHTREIDSVRVKGKREPVVIYEVLGKGKPNQDAAVLIESFEKGISLYKQQDWQGASAIFDQVRKEMKPNDFAANMYIQRCQQMAESPPGGDWDGVYTMTTK